MCVRVLCVTLHHYNTMRKLLPNYIYVPHCIYIIKMVKAIF